MVFEVSAEEAEARVDRVVYARLSWTRSAVAELFRDGRVRVNGRRVAKGYRVSVADVVVCEGALLDGMHAQADPSVEVTVLHEDAQLLVVDKPAGLPVHPLRPGETGCLANGLVARFPALRGVGREPRQPGLLNRLDNDTSGLILVARTQPTFDELLRALQSGQIKKRYLAVCERHPAGSELSWRMAPDPGDRRRMVCEMRPAGFGELGAELPWKPACTRVVGARAYHDDVLVEVEAHRALRHQVRAHLAAAGSPIAGDTLYGGRLLRCGHHLLHACQVSLTNPITRRRVQVESPLPAGWPRLLERDP